MERNPIYEQVLDKSGVSWEYLESVSLDQVSRRKGLDNQARLEQPIDEDLVARYAERKREGDQFPAIVCYFERNRYIPIDGNNRLAADDKNGTKKGDIYLVKSSDPMVLARLTWIFNNEVNGKRLTRAECIQHAVSYVRLFGQSIKVASETWGLRRDEVTQAVSVVECREALAAAGVKDTKALTDGGIYALASLRTVGDDVFVAAVKVAIENGLLVKHIHEMSQRVRAAKTHEAKVATIAELAGLPEVADQRAKTRGGRIKAKPTPDAQAASALRNAARIFGLFPDDRAFRGPNFKETRKVAEEVFNRLASIYGLGAKTGKEAS